jgi:hypothetical protein
VERVDAARRGLDVEGEIRGLAGSESLL